MPTVTVETDQGPLTVKTRLNAEGQVTGRVDGKTYKGTTWADVEKKIRKAFRGYPPMEKYLSVTFMRIGDQTWGSDACVVEDPKDTYGCAISYQVVEVSDVCGEAERRGRWIREDPDRRPEFRVVQTEDDLRSLIDHCNSGRLVKWTQEIQDELDTIIHRLRNLAGALDDLLAPELLPELAGNSQRALKAATNPSTPK